MININKYNSIGNVIGIQNFVYPSEFTFVVFESDYTNLYATRYFVQKINGGSVIEVSGNQYDKISKQLFIKVNLNWYLIGYEKNIYKDGKIYENGIYEKNKEQVNIASKILPDIKNKIKNYTQYARFIKN
jgi:hypothetical protein